MYMNFWYPIAKSGDVTNEKPFRTHLMGLRYVAFRDDKGQAHVLSDTCVHRGGSLGKGWVKDNNVVCPYHGWRYNGEGVCTRVPSIGNDGKPPARAKVDSYPVQEKYGIVFAFLGDLPEEERPPIYEIEEYGAEGWRASEVIILDAPFYFERSVENGLDPAHNEFVHPTQGSPGMLQDFRKEPLKLDPLPFGHKFFLTFREDSQETQLKDLRGSKMEISAGSGHLGPNQLITWIQFSADNIFHQYFFEAPVDDKSTRIFFINLRNCMLDEDMDEGVNKINLQVAEEDIAVLAELNPVRTPDSNAKEVLMPADAPIVRYREFLKEWDERGWKVDFDALKARSGDAAFAIPSPARRQSGNWVLEAVPTVPPSRARKAAAE